MEAILRRKSKIVKHAAVLQHHEIAKGVKRLVLEDSFITSYQAFRVSSPPMDAGQLDAERGNFFLLVLGGDEAVGFVLVAGVEGFLFAGGVILAVINTPRAEEYAVSLFHVIFHVMTMNHSI